VILIFICASKKCLHQLVILLKMVGIGAKALGGPYLALYIFSDFPSITLSFSVLKWLRF
jgi:hypothetical protein